MPRRFVIIQRLRSAVGGRPRLHLAVAGVVALALAGVALALPGSGAPSSAVPAIDAGLGALDARHDGLQGWTATARAVQVGGLRRGYLLVRPRDPEPEAMPLVVVLHGRNMTPSGMINRAGLLGMRGVVIAAPLGYGRSWNAGDCCAAARKAQVDDVSFVSDVVRDVLDTRADVDPRQVYLIGYSNGGRMAYRMACRRPGLFAGVAAVEAVPMDPCRSVARSVPLLVVASTGDPLLRLTPSAPPQRIEGSVQPSVEDAVRLWRTLDGCPGEPSRHVEGRLTADRWTPCRGGGRVGLDLYRGGRHAWPTGTRGTGGTAGTPGALQEIWSFLRA